MDSTRTDTRCVLAAARITLYAVLIGLCCMPTCAHAQVTGSAPAAPALALVKRVGEVATVFWTAPTTYSDNTPLGSVTLTYTVYAAAPGAAWKVASTAPVSGLTWSSAALVKGTQCYIVTDTAAGLESLPSGTICLGAGAAGNPPGAVGVR
jgi:hypothetical protein